MTEQGVPQRVRVIESHVTSDPNPVRFREGDRVGVGHHDQVWKQYVWGTDQAGRSGWVPDAYLEIAGNGQTGHRLARLRLHRAHRGPQGDPRRRSTRSAAGTCAARESGMSGWVPSTSVEPVEPAGRAEGGPGGRRPRRPPRTSPARRVGHHAGDMAEPRLGEVRRIPVVERLAPVRGGVAVVDPLTALPAGADHHVLPLDPRRPPRCPDRRCRRPPTSEAGREYARDVAGVAGGAG